MNEATKNASRVENIARELSTAMEVHTDIPAHVTMFGSARLNEGTEAYEKARALAGLLAEKGYGVMTGGGPGIMEAGNRGAKEAGGPSLAATIQLPFEQSGNPYLDDCSDHKYFFVRKYFLTTNAVAFVACEGGIGTLDELMEILTLIQTGKIQKVPVVLLGKSFWSGLVDWMGRELVGRGVISPDDMYLFKVVDTPEEAAWYIGANCPLS